MLSGGSDDSSVSLCCQKYTHWTKEHHMFFSMKLFIFDFSVYMFLILYIKLNMFILHVLFCDNRSFLLGLEKCGQGEEKWKKISTYFLTSKTLTQIVSHVQKYFLRKNVPEKGRRRRSIHDMIPLQVDQHNWVSDAQNFAMQSHEMQHAHNMLQFDLLNNMSHQY